MDLTRRDAYQKLSSFALSLGAPAAFASCSTRQEAKSTAKVAVLLPLSGNLQVFGRTIERAARLAASSELDLLVVDTGGSAEGAKRASHSLASFKPEAIVGPVSSSEARALGPTGPMLALSNDEALQSIGVFTMGVTATQSTRSILSYARTAGVRRLALLGGKSAWGERCNAVAISEAARLGIEITASADPKSGNLIDALRQEGNLPEAVFVANGGDDLRACAEALQAEGLQILGTSQWSPDDVRLPGAVGSWIATADAAASARFSEAYEREFAEKPGMIAGLAYDAVFALATLARAGEVSRSGLTRPEGFSGVTGMFRFTPQGHSERKLAIIVASPSGGIRASTESGAMGIVRNAPRGDAGFSLLEIVVALGLFALISLAGVILVSSILQVRDRTEGRLEELGDLQRGLVLIASDFHQASPKSVRIDARGVSLDRSGAEGRLTIEYAVVGGKLLRSLSGKGASGPSQTLLDKISGVRWRVLTRDSGWVETWPQTNISDESAIPDPIAVAVELDLDPARAGVSGTLRRVVELATAP